MFFKARSPKNNTYSMGKLDHLFGTVFLPHKGQYGSQVLRLNSTVTQLIGQMP